MCKNIKVVDQNYINEIAHPNRNDKHQPLEVLTNVSLHCHECVYFKVFGSYH